jgi:amino acid adenylation domain-containing protein/non-ribosomal peptide synthase protein (TIGR01720 family)
MQENSPGPQSLDEKRRRLLEILLQKRGLHGEPQSAPKEPAAAMPTDAGSDLLSFGQLGLWFRDRLQGSRAYNVPFVFELIGRVDRSALRGAFEAAVRRHAALRSRFVEDSGSPRVLVEAELPGFYEEVDYTHRPEAEAEKLADEAARLEVEREFDLALGPLVRVKAAFVSERRCLIILVVHHIVFDGRSASVFLQDVEENYRTLLHTGQPAHRQPALDYRDFAAWQRGWLHGDRLEKKVEFWRAELAGAPETSCFPTDRPRPLDRSAAAGRVDIRIPADVTIRLRRLGEGRGTSLFMTLLAGLHALLFRWTTQEDSIIGFPFASRERDELKNVVGLLANIVPNRCRVDSETTFEELLVQVRDRILESHPHHDLPFEKLVEELRVERDSRNNPFFQVLFALQETVSVQLQLEGASSRWVRIANGAAKFDLNVEIFVDKDELECIFEYASDVFDRETIERLGAHYELLLRQAAQDPRQRVSGFELLTAEERELVLETWNTTDAPYEAGACVHELIERQCELTPNRIAISAVDGEVTYRALNERANRLARLLRGRGVGPETRVGICVERNVRLVEVLLGVWKAGGAYVPLDPDYPTDRLELMLSDAEADVIVTESALAGRLNAWAERLVVLEECAEELAQESCENPVSLAGPNNLAYMIYTSGSTGRPKAVMLEHRSVVNFLESMRREPGLSEHDVLLAVTTISFDIAVLELYLPLLVGAKILLATREDVLDGSKLAKSLEAASVMDATPTSWRMLLESGWKGQPNLRAFSGGEPMTRELSARLRECCAEVWNLYGPTETTVYSTLERENNDGVASIGKPVANTQVYILDASLRPTPIGVVGELYIAGDGLARGYWKREELTAERFLDNPFRPDGKMYRTGDLARWLPSGKIECLGRIDHQVKIRGHRIELGEIEARLEQLGEVRQAVVVAQGSGGQTRLIAYVRAEDGQSVSAGDLRKHLRRSLPDYMLPAAYVELQEFPVTPNGKVNRLALPAPKVEDELQSGPAFEPPGNPLEELLAGIWTAVLERERIGANDNFFDLGGHSLSIAKMVARVRTATGVELPLRDAFQYPTVAELARRIESLKLGAETAPLPPISRRPAASAAPLSFQQQRLWFLHQMQPGSSAYHIPQARRVKGQFRVDILERCVWEVQQRHEILRTRYDEPATQVVEDAPALDFRVVELRSATAEEREAELAVVAERHAKGAFDLRSGSVFRTAVFRISDFDHLILVVFHHIAADGWSLGVFWNELSRLYHAFCRNEPSPLAPVGIQYRDYAGWQRDHLQGEMLNERVRYWREALEDADPVLAFPIDKPRPPVQTLAGSVRTRHYSRELLQKLRALSQERNATLFMTLMAAYQVLLSRYTGQEEFLVGTAFANRERVETEPVIGFFTSTLILRSDLKGNPSFTNLVGRVRTICLDAYAHQDVPFERLVEELHPDRDLSRSPVVQVVFALQDMPAASASFDGLSVTTVDLHPGGSKFDMSLGMASSADGLLAQVEYNSDLFHPETIDLLLERFSILLQAIVEAPEKRIAEYGLLSDPEQHRVLVSWNETETRFDTSLLVHELFERQAETAPERLAVASADEAVSYGELNQRANNLAHRLHQAGIGREDVVAVLLEPSVDMIAAQLAALKAGAAYMPLDPSTPTARLEHMLGGGAAKALVTKGSRDIAAVPGLLVVDLNDVQASSASEALNPKRLDSAGNLAYVIYTSGSTGQPKGVEIEHRGLLNLVHWHCEAYDVHPGDRASQVANPAFDACVWETWPYLTRGASIWIPEASVRASAEDLIAWMREKEISITFLPTPLAETVLAQPIPDNLRLRYLLTGGDRLHRIPQCPLPFRLVNHYGPTENTVVSTCGVVDPLEQGEGLPPIGRPIANTHLYILDPRSLQPTPPGAAGEIFVGGASLARGYRRQPQLTSEKFIPSPFSGGAARLYRTGDLARHLRNGEVEFLGRADQQVKIRGFRIELGEIEAALQAQPGVQECVVIARQGSGGAARLAAYLVRHDAADVTEERLREGLQLRLPAYMMPATYTILERFPLTANGKIDRRRLPEPETFTPEAAEIAPPRNEIEEMLCAIWSRVFGIESVGVDQNFFDLGGDSILSLQVIFEAKRQGLRITAKQIFQKQTIAELAAVAEQETAQSPQEQVATGVYFPLTSIQSWFFDHFSERPNHFNQSILLCLKRPVEPHALARSVQALIRRHDTLRLRFQVDSRGRQMQWIAPEETTDAVAHIDLRDVGESQRAATLTKRCEELHASLDIVNGPIVRAAVFVLGPDEPQRFFLAIHHLAVDAVSWRFLIEDLDALLSNPTAESEAVLPPKTSSYQRWAEQMSRRANSRAVEIEEPYWLAAGQETVCMLPRDYPRSGRASLEHVVEVVLDEETTLCLVHELPSAYGADVDHLLVAALDAVISRWCGGPFAIDTESHGRATLFDAVDVSRTVGWFTALYPVILGREEGSTHDRISRVRDAMESVPAMGTGFGLLRYGRDGGPALARPRAEILFNYLGRIDPDHWASNTFALAPERDGAARTNGLLSPYLLEINCSVSGGRLRSTWLYSQSVHRPETVERLANAVFDELKRQARDATQLEEREVGAHEFAAAQMSEHDLAVLFGGQSGSNR